MVQNILELGSGLSALIYKDGIESPEKPEKAAFRRTQLIGNGGLQQIDRVGRLVVFQSDKCTNRRDVTELDGGILREAPFQIVYECLRPGGISGESQGKGGTILHIPGAFESSSPAVAVRLAAPKFPNRASRTAAPAW